jgi:hypothetical protein
VAIVNLGRDPKSAAGAAYYEKENVLEELDTCRENVRCAVAGFRIFALDLNSLTFNIMLIWLFLK